MSEPITISLSPAIVHFTDLVKGNTLAFLITMTDSNNNAIDVSADNFEMEICRADGTLLTTLGLGNGLEITGPGTIYGEMPPADTANLSPNLTYIYEVKWTTGTYVRNISWGTINVMITKP